jgi:mRNA interferase MazF
MAMVVVKRFDVFLVSLDPTIGSEIRKTRPCVIISPDEMNRHISTVVIAPMTTRGNVYPSRISLTFQGKKGEVVLDHIRTVDKVRLVKRLGSLTESTAKSVSSRLVEMFAY